MIRLGLTDYRGRHSPILISENDRMRHVHILGKTGQGKSTLMENMVAQDIAHGHSVVLIDPHGSLAERVLSFVPTSRFDDVLYFNPGDFSRPVGYNPLARGGNNDLKVSGLISSLKNYWSKAMESAPRMEWILRNAIYAQLESPSPTLLGVLRMLTDDRYRTTIVKNVHNPVVKDFWSVQFAQYHDRLRTEAIAPIQNKVGALLVAPFMLNIFGQVSGKLDMVQTLHPNRILIVNLNKGVIGEDNANLLGSFILTDIFNAVLSRPAHPIFLYVDEFQNFTNDSLPTMLSEARKYNLSLTLAHQFLGQLEEKMRQAIYGNVGTLITFAVGNEDAALVAREFSPLPSEDIINLSRGATYLKLCIDASTSQPFSMLCDAPRPAILNSKQVNTLKTLSGRKYGVERRVIEEKIARWLS